MALLYSARRRIPCLTAIACVVAAAACGLEEEEPLVDDGSGGSAATSAEELFVGNRYGQRSVTFDDCGAESGPTRVFKSGLANDPALATYHWQRTERTVRLGETGAAYTLQLFDGSAPVFNYGDREGTLSPLVRLVTSDATRRGKGLDSCSFEGTSALIFAYGNDKPRAGDSLDSLDERLLDALVRWNGAPTLPRAGVSPDKLTAPPGYVQVVHNDVATSGGLEAAHSKSAIREFANDLELAFRAGLRNVEVVSHGEGMITTHLGYSLFVERMASDRRATFMARATSRGVGPLPAIDDPDCVPKLEALLRSEPPMTIAMFHLQAAPRSVSAIVADDDGFYGDFVPILEGKGKPTGGAPLAHDYDTYLRGVFPYVLPSFRFFYNNGDTRTAGTASGAGITRSTTWVRDVRPAATTSSGLFVGHYLCDRDGVADLNEADTECRVGESSATEHDPRFALSALSNPLRTLVWRSVE